MYAYHKTIQQNSSKASTPAVASSEKATAPVSLAPQPEHNLSNITVTSGTTANPLQFGGPKKNGAGSVKRQDKVEKEQKKLAALRDDFDQYRRDNRGFEKSSHRDYQTELGQLDGLLRRGDRPAAELKKKFEDLQTWGSSGKRVVTGGLTAPLPAIPSATTPTPTTGTKATTGTTGSTVVTPPPLKAATPSPGTGVKKPKPKKG